MFLYLVSSTESRASRPWGPGLDKVVAFYGKELSWLYFVPTFLIFRSLWSGIEKSVIFEARPNLKNGWINRPFEPQEPFLELKYKMICWGPKWVIFSSFFESAEKSKI